MRVLVLRHGHTSWNEEGRYQGQSDLPLSRLGRQEAEAVGRWLPDLVPPSVAVWSSDLVRARETAALALPGRPFTVDHRLRELHFGVFEGETSAGNARRHGATFHRWMTDPDGFPPEGGETPALLERRVLDWLHEATGSGPTPLVVVTHGGPARVLAGALAGLSPAQAWQLPLPPCGLLLLERGAPPRQPTPDDAPFLHPDTEGLIP